MKNLILLGASGSIGSQTIYLLKKNILEYNLIGVSVGKNIEVLHDILCGFNNIEAVYALDNPKLDDIKNEFPEVIIYTEKDGWEEFLNYFKKKCVIVENALVGFIGVEPCLISIKLGYDLALANKESLVVAGELINNELKHSKSKIYPIDSEHVAITKLLKKVNIDEVKNIVITCSGGPFNGYKKEQLENVTKNDALKHPTWKMGQKITIDSATLINKVFEIIEAYYLFNSYFDNKLDPSNIKVIIHKESKVHSMLEMKDGEYIMEYGLNDMIIPISYALSEFKRIPVVDNSSCLINESLTFVKPNKFQQNVLNIAYNVLSKKGNMGCILNSANDFAVKMFLENKISFLEIYELISKAIDNIEFIENPSFFDIISTHNNVEYYLLSLINK